MPYLNIMLRNCLIVASKKDRAGINITTHLSNFGSFKFYLIEDEIIFTKNLDMKIINKYDFIIFASKHQSVKKEKTLSVHSFGNWNKADFGGEIEKISPTSALFMKKIFECLNENQLKFNLKDFKVTLEATHHGPLIEKPGLFIEIGSTLAEWRNQKAGFIVARAIKQAIEEFEVDECREIAIGIGGPHYCPNFNKIQLNSNIAISYIIPKYALPLTTKMLEQIRENTTEEVDFVLLDWKSLGSSEEKREVLKKLDEFYIEYKKTKEIKK